MKLVGKVPVEPLDDERLTNIERNLVVHVSEMAQRPLHSMPRRMFAMAGIAFAAIVAGFIGWKLRGTEGMPSIAPPPEREALVMKDGALHLADADIAGKDFTLTRWDTRVVVTMQKAGVLDLRVDHKPGRLFVVKAGDVEVEDVGTRFSVDWDGGKNVDVRVTEGSVKVKSGGKEFSLAAGQAFGIDIGPVTIAALDAKRTEPAMTTTTTTAAVDPQPSAPVIAMAPTSNGSNGSNGGSAQGSGAKTHKAGTTNARKALEKAEYEKPVDVGTDDPKAAIAKYLELVKNMPEREDNARLLYSMAVMNHRAKNDAQALYMISGLLNRRGGPAYQAALWLNVRVRCLKAFDDLCRMAAEKYVSKFDLGVQAGVAQEILREISRGQ
jgi:hypothetical protein